MQKLVQVWLHHYYRAYTHTELLCKGSVTGMVGMGGQGIGVQGVLGSIPGGGETPFDGVSFKWDRYR